MRPGFTLIEVMLALALLACGLLGVAAAAGTAAGLATEGARAARAVSAARNRIELLAAGECPEEAASGTGYNDIDLVREHWSFQRRGQLAIARDSVTHGRPGRTRTIVLEAVVPC